jgi:hypothetical protein
MRLQSQSRPLTTAEREAAECTFKPTLATTHYRPHHHSPEREPKDRRPSGYAQAVERLRRSVQDKANELAEADKEAKRRAALAGKPPKPFHLETEARVQRRHPLLYMDVNLGPGRTGRIGLHGDDDPAALAANFARAYGLDDSMQAKLQGLIERYLREVVPGLATAREGSAAPGDALRSPSSPSTPKAIQ